ncbi:MAG: DUF4386 domain-containing protein [Saprospiraceae bacterium]|nr:DUF4386 domain-containing protein [Saprospiraceae bacterium]
MSNSLLSRTIGCLFLAAIFTYATGSALVNNILSATEFPANPSGVPFPLSAGGFLMLLNSLAVVGIGVLMANILKPRFALVARFYLVSRLVEAVLLLIGVIALLSAIVVVRKNSGDPALLQLILEQAKMTNYYAYQTAMLTLGVGSLGLCYAFLKGGITPRYLAWWGLVGYAIFTLGAVLELFGIEAGLMLSVPGGLFEVFFGGWLLFKPLKFNSL